MLEYGVSGTFSSSPVVCRGYCATPSPNVVDPDVKYTRYILPCKVEGGGQNEVTIYIELPDASLPNQPFKLSLSQIPVPR